MTNEAAARTRARARASDDVAWPEALAAWVERLPMPAWLFYALLGTVGVAYTVVISTSLGQPYTLLEVIAGVYTGYILGGRHYLTNAARHAARRFRPLLAVDDAQFAEIERRLTTTSAREGWVGTVLGAGAGIATAYLVYVLLPDALPRIGWTRDQYLIEWVPLLAIAYALGVLFLRRTYRQLRVIQELHASAPEIDPLRAGPVSAFSTLTMRISLVLFIPLYGQLIGSLELASSTPLALLPIVIGNVIAVLIFVVPLLGLHSRLEASRSAQLDLVGKRLQTVVAELSGRIERGDLGDAAPLQQAIMSLVAARDTLLRVQTWPWRPGTFNTFLSVIGAPIVIYILTRVLARFV